MNTANNLVYLIVSVLLSFMGLSGLFGKRNISKIEVEVELPEELFANRPAPVKVRVKNLKKFFPGFLLRVSVGDGKVLFHYVDARSEAMKYLTLSFEKRGKHILPDFRVCSVFPFNFFMRCSDSGKGFDVIVFPEPKRCDLPASFGKPRSRGEVSSRKAGYDSETLSTRVYVQGDPLKYIDWKATAKTGELKTKELSALSDPPVVIDFDSVPARSGEERASFAAYAVLNLFRKNIPTGLKIGGRLYRPATSVAHKLALLRELALYGTKE